MFYNKNILLQSQADRMTDYHLRDSLFWLLRGLLVCLQSEIHFSLKLNSYVLEKKIIHPLILSLWGLFLSPPSLIFIVWNYNFITAVNVAYRVQKKWSSAPGSRELPGLPVECCMETPVSTMKEVPWVQKATQLPLHRGGSSSPLSSLLTQTSGTDIN